MPELSSKETRANHQIARAAGTVMVAFIFSNIIGLIAKTLTARAYGTGAEGEAFFAANRFSEILFNLVAGGALGSAFIPTFTGFLTNNDHKNAWRLASAIANLVLVVLLILCMLSIVFARQVVHYILAPGFSIADPGKELLTAQLLRIQIPSALIFGLSGLVMGILNAHQHFFLPAIAPAMYQVGWVIGVLVLKPYFGVQGLSIGILIGSIFHLLVQIPKLIRLPQANYQPTLGIKIPAVREVARLMAPRLLGVAVVQLNFLLNTFLASMQSEGSVTAISLAFPLMIMPEAAIAQSIAIAALPTFSAQFAMKKMAEMRASFSNTLRGIFLLSLPACTGLILLRKQIVALLYLGGEFNSMSVDLVAWALLWYAAGLVGHGIVEITSRAFYALHDTKTPVIIGVGAMSLNLVFSLGFSALFMKINWMPHGGLALANSLATILESVVLLLIMRKRLNGLEERKIWLSAKNIILGTTFLSLSVLWWLSFSNNFPNWFVVVGGIAVGTVVYAVSLLLQRNKEIKELMALIKQQFIQSPK